MKILGAMDYEDHEFSEDPWELARDAGINVLSDKELHEVALENGNLVGASFISNDRETFSFDIAVRPDKQGQGIGTKLISGAMEEYDFLKDVYPDIELELDVVNKRFATFLQREYGLKITNTVAGHIYLKESFMKKVIYHGDNYGTTKLNPKRMLVGNSQEGVGIYFSDSRSTAEDYGKHIVSVEVDTRNLIPSREYVDEHIPDRKLLPFLKACFVENVEDVWMLMTDYGIEVYTPEEVEDHHIEEFVELLHDEQVRNFQITIAQAVGVEDFVELWNKYIGVDGTYHSNSENEMWYAIINTELKVMKKEGKLMKTITLPENVTIDMGDREVILEKGDRIRVVQEASYYLDEYFEYVIPVWAIPAIKTGDTSGLSSDQKRKIREFEKVAMDAVRENEGVDYSIDWPWDIEQSVYEGYPYDPFQGEQDVVAVKIFIGH